MLKRRTLKTALAAVISLAVLAAVPTLDPHSEPQALVQGEIPDPANPPTGCRFSSRCPLASERCRREPPALREIVPGHRVACHWVAP